MDNYIYNSDESIRTKDSIEHYKQTTPDNNQAVIAYIEDIEYKQSSGKWQSAGYRWAIVEPHLTEKEVIQWLMNNGQKSVGFLRN